MHDIPLVIRQIGILCSELASDDTLKGLLDESGLPEDTWARIIMAVRRGETEELTPLLETLEDVAAAAGLDGVTVQTRAYQPLPAAAPLLRTVSGWRCPHVRPCERLEIGADPRIERRCELTGDPLTWASVTSG
ncbi:hypothetical protein ABTZ03_33620 [Kitasatospora sp. NPDC096077]|uniref:hypothetical protein n=1 Tax=Kitasatospora sp. NPDC096077 TaxID=3155544 RepID=UPI003323D0B5